MWRNLPVAAIVLFITGVQAQYGVTLSSQSLCAVIGSTVKIPCTISKPYKSSVTQKGWYRVQSSKAEPQHLSEDPQYSGRVSVGTWSSDCELTLTDVRVSDSGVYNFRFKRGNSGWISASSGVQLTVTDLQVNLDPDTVGWREVKLTCSSTCRLNARTFNWYRNGNYFKTTSDSFIMIYSRSLNDGSYACKVSDSNHRSPSVCVLGKECWGVTYTPKQVCGLQGTSIDVSCSYKHPAGLTVIKSVWFVKEQAGVKPLDIRKDEEYRDRVQFIQNDCRLRITNLTERDAQTYKFRFFTDDPTGKYTGEPGVTLSVTDLKITVSQSSSGEIELNCVTNCTLSNSLSYIWYKNGQRVSDCKSDSCSVTAVADAVGYSCAVEGHESLPSPPVYSPRNTTAELLSSGDTVEGDSVTLSCSSDANPPDLTYTWFKQSAPADTVLTTGQNYSISNVSSQHSVLYYCTAHHLLGHHNSTPTRLDVFCSKKNEVESSQFIVVGLIVFLVLIIIAGSLWMWYWKSRSCDSRSSTDESEALQSAVVYETVSVSNHSGRFASDAQDDLQYTSVILKR